VADFTWIVAAPLVLTAAGELLYERSRSLLQNLERTQADVAATAGYVTGQVTLGLVPTLGHDYIANILANYHQQFPQVSLSIKSAMSGTLQQLAAQKRVDLAIIYSPSNRRNLNFQHLLEENLYLVSPANNPFANHKSVSLKTVLDQPLMLPEEKCFRTVCVNHPFRE